MVGPGGFHLGPMLSLTFCIVNENYNQYYTQTTPRTIPQISAGECCAFPGAPGASGGDPREYVALEKLHPSTLTLEWDLENYTPGNDQFISCV